MCWGFGKAQNKQALTRVNFARNFRWGIANGKQLKIGFEAVSPGLPFPNPITLLPGPVILVGTFEKLGPSLLLCINTCCELVYQIIRNHDETITYEGQGISEKRM